MSNEFRAFATAPGANTMTASAWAALTTLLANGFQPGVASSEQINTLLRQLSVGVTGVAQLAQNQGQDMLDDGSAANFAAKLLAALQNIADARVRIVTTAEVTPPGMIAHFWRTTAPAGWIEAAGQTVLRAAYPNLYTALSGLVATPDANSFTLPDLRGEFLRGWDHGRNVDPTRAFGTWQSDAMQRILGRLGVDDRVWGQVGDVAGNAFVALPETVGADTTAEGGDGRHLEVQFDSGRVTRSGTETRPRNIAVLVCLKT